MLGIMVVCLIASCGLLLTVLFPLPSVVAAEEPPGVLVGPEPALPGDPSDVTQVWDVTADWSDQINPNFPWSYGYQPFGSSQFFAFTNNYFDGTTHSWVWNAPIAGIEAHVWKNEDTITYYGIHPGELCMHPGIHEYCVIRWTSPVNGQVTLEGQFGTGDTSAMDAWIKVKGVIIWSAQDFQWDDQAFSKQFSVEAWDTVELLVGGTGHYSYGSTPIRAKITYGSTAAPHITSISSNTSRPGTPATIKGTGFDRTALNNTVLFGQYGAQVNNATRTKLRVTIPPSCSHNTKYWVTVTVGGQISNRVKFKVK